MIAARIHDWGAQPVVEEVHEPEPGAGEVLVELAAGSVAHIDVTVASGRFPHRPSLPHVPGTEGAGLVRSSGTPVRIRGGGVGLTRDGTWAELVAVPEEALWPLPDGVDPVLAAVFFSPCVTAHLALHEVGALDPGETVAVRGAGGAVGSVAVQLALAGGAGEVIGVESSEAKAAAIPPGATAVVGGGGIRGVDLLVDLVGGDGLAAAVTEWVRPGGRAVLVGYVGGTETAFHLPALLAADVRLLPVNLIRAESRAGELAGELLERLRGGELTLNVETYPLARVSDAMERLQRGEATGKVAILPREGSGG